MKPLGPIAYILKMRVTLLRDLGAAMAPFNAFLFLQGVETLALRMRAHSENALAVANYLAERKGVTRVIHPSRHTGVGAQRTAKYLTKGMGGLCGFELAGGVDAGRKFINSLKMFYHVANIGDARSLAIHPASTTHSQLDGGGTSGDRRDPRLCAPVHRHRAHRRHHRRSRPGAGRGRRMTTPTGVHLIGSVPMADAETVFRSVARELGPWLARIPDGETGNRHRWIWWQREMLLNHPAMELDPVTPPFELRQWDGAVLRTTEWIRFRPGIDPATVTFDTGYARGRDRLLRGVSPPARCG